ncbi:MAG: glycoside hydrolase family 65 protein [Nitriliruptorales bacterium]|nr:glycoside hydrolase family 65 protein [Nitriliruptorales bacterium]
MLENRCEGTAVQRREPVPLPRHDYPVEPWRLIERRFNEQFLPRSETLFTVANGHLGLRGSHDEGRPAHEQSTLIAGFHETWPIVHAEEAYGLAKTGQTIVDVPDAKIIKLYVDDEPLFLPTAHLSQYERVLDFRAGMLERSLLWKTQSGKKVEVRSRRLVSMRYRHLAVLQFEVRVLNGDAPIVISSQVVNREDAGAPDERPGEFDPRVRRIASRVLECVDHRVDGERILLGYRTATSGMTLGCGVDHVMETDCPYEVTGEATKDVGKIAYIIEAVSGSTIRLTKYVAYHTSRSVPPRELIDRADRVLRRAVSSGFDTIASQQRELLDDFWARSDVEIAGDDFVQQAVRWNLFQLFQASARAEGSGIPSKGLSGHGYEGHYFWDIEIFILPFLCYVEPRIAENLLRFRHSMLGKARERAAELNQAGALFPWRTINGEEASAYYQAGTAQYHLDADIAYALKRYVDVTGDRALLYGIGVELLVETARLWVDLGFYDEDGKFHLFTVTGPDEYTTVVNDNAYTNLMARLNLNYAVSSLISLRNDDPERYTVLCEDLGLRSTEIEDWMRAARAMHVPYDERRGINPQDAQFLNREVWDFDTTPPEKYPLLLHYHPLVIYRHQVIKQADVVLAMFLLGNEFPLNQKHRNFDYYDPLTTSDSSLSPPVHSIVAAEVGDEKRAMEHFRLALLMDLADVAGNSSHGVHIASTGGVWMALVYGFGGMRDFDGELSFDPLLPSAWSRLSFPLTVRGRRMKVELTPGCITLLLHSGEPIAVTVRGERIDLCAGEPVDVVVGQRNGAT